MNADGKAELKCNTEDKLSTASLIILSCEPPLIRLCMWTAGLSSL